MRRGELTHGLLPFREAAEHGPASWVAEGAEDEVEAVRLFNHMVEYMSAPAIVNPSVDDQSDVRALPRPGLMIFGGHTGGELIERIQPAIGKRLPRHPGFGNDEAG